VDIPIDVPSNQNIGGDVPPASLAGLTPVSFCSASQIVGRFSVKRTDLICPWVCGFFVWM